MLTYEVARDMTGQSLRYAELTCTPYTSVRRAASRSRPTPRRSRTRGSRPSATSGWCCAGSTTSPARRGCPAADATLDYALHHAPDALVGFGLGGPEIGVPRPQFQPHFDAARAAGLHSVPARRRDDRPGDGLGRRPAARRRADRPRHQRRAGPRAARPPGRRGHPAGGLPVLQRRHPRGRAARRPPAARRSSTRACRSPSTPTTRRCSAPPSTRSTPSPPSCSTSTRRGSPSWRGRRCGRRSRRTSVKASLLAEIDGVRAADR